MRSAVFFPRPLSLAREEVFPEATASRTAWGVVPARMERAVLGPTPET